MAFTLVPALAAAADPPGAAVRVQRFELASSGLELARPTHAGRFFDVVGRRSAVFGYENGALEAWAYPLKLVDDFSLSFRVEGYPLEIDGRQIQSHIAVRPESTTFTYSHAAFTVRQTVFAPQDEPGVVMLLDVDSVLPLSVIGSFRPRLRLMWPAGLMTANVGWDGKEQAYSLTEESRRFAAVLAVPGARDVSLMPYQEEPREAPVRFEVQVPPGDMRTELVPVVMAGSVAGVDEAKATCNRLLASARALYEANVVYFRGLQERTLRVETPDARLDTAFAWAKVGVDKGFAANPMLGTGLVAGFRTSGDSERPGFAWMFGRDALWTALAIDSYGDFAAARTALEFLRRRQRQDGKIPHEISQSAALVPWFTDYPYAWDSADATPLYVVAQADHWRHSGDRDFLGASWDSIVRAWRFTAGTDTDGNGLVENTGFGHGWTEGSPPYPPHEEIYLQGVWMEACRDLAELADVQGDGALAARARAAGERTRAAVEKTYWLGGRGFYAFATALASQPPYQAEPGPLRAERQGRIDALRGHTLVDEDTVLPAVALWWRQLEAERAQSEIDHLGSSALAADWGQRLLSADSQLYDPLSYHYGSVWPLFTGWAAVAAYEYGRPAVGYRALMTNALLTWPWALGDVTELLSGAFHAPFGRSSHHQVWSEAMVVTPLVRGLLGLEVTDGGRRLRFAPQLPADWDRVSVKRVAAGKASLDLALERGSGRMTIRATTTAGTAPELTVAPAFPLDARVRGVTVDGAQGRFEVRPEGDVQRVEVKLPTGTELARRVDFDYDEGTDVYARVELPEAGGRSEGLRILRSRADEGALRLTVEGRGGRTYEIGVRTPHRVEETSGVTVTPTAGGATLTIAFEGSGDAYSRRQIVLPLH